MSAFGRSREILSITIGGVLVSGLLACRLGFGAFELPAIRAPIAIILSYAAMFAVALYYIRSGELRGYMSRHSIETPAWAELSRVFRLERRSVSPYSLR